MNEYEETISWARKAVQIYSHCLPHVYLTAGLAKLDMNDEAAVALRDLETFEPNFGAEFFRKYFPGDKFHFDTIWDALCKAGLSAA